MFHVEHFGLLYIIDNVPRGTLSFNFYPDLPHLLVKIIYIFYKKLYTKLLFNLFIFGTIFSFS